MAEKHVVFGATGALGSAIVRNLVSSGEEVVAAVRDVGKAKSLLPPDITVSRCNALKVDEVKSASRDAAVIYHTVNFPYGMWEEMAQRTASNIIEAASENRSIIMFPGNVYGYGRFHNHSISEDYPHAAESRKGKIRNMIEDSLFRAYREERIGLVIPRFPDFYGPNVTNELFGQIFRSALAGRRVVWIGKPDVPHDFIFIDDAARASTLLSRSREAHGQVWHVPGPGAITARRFMDMISREIGRKVDMRVMGRTRLRFYGLFTPAIREVIELLYQYEEPYILDGTKFEQMFPAFRFTPHEEGIRQTLDWFRYHGMTAKY